MLDLDDLLDLDYYVKIHLHLMRYSILKEFTLYSTFIDINLGTEMVLSDIQYQRHHSLVEVS